jgi:hypothetical protein
MSSNDDVNEAYQKALEAREKMLDARPRKRSLTRPHVVRS